MPDQSLSAIDWDCIWNEAMERTTLKGDGVSFWNKAAPCLSKNYSSQNNYVEQLQKRMQLGPGKTILDVGAGTGTMALPLSRQVASVTALDLSPAMLEFLEKEIEKKGITNIKTVQADFLDADAGQLGKHDIVVASRSLPMGNLRQAVQKMDSLAENLCYLTWIASSRKLDIEVCRIMGKPYYPYPSYLIIANLLYTMGIYANIELFDVTNTQIYESLDEGVDSVLRGKEITADQRKNICNYFSGCMERSGEGWKYTFSNRWALIWWQK